MTEIKHLRRALTVQHVLGAVFAAVVLGISAATIAEANKAAAAVNAGPTGLNFHRKLLAQFSLGLDNLGATGALLVISFSTFLNFTLFVSISGLLLSGFLAACYLRPAVYDATLGALAAKSPAWAKWPFYELVLACVWSIFWLAAAGAASDSPIARITGYCTGVSACDQLNAVLALSWLSWLNWLAVVVLLAVEMGIAARKVRKTAAAPAATAAAKPAEPKAAETKSATTEAQPAVEMVTAAKD